MAYIDTQRLSEINLNDRFFNSLKDNYQEFSNWFNRKASQGHDAFVLYEDDELLAFLYLKIEDEELNDVLPLLPRKKRLKVGTFKIDAHGTKLGERFIKRIFDTAIVYNIEEIYVTIFEEYAPLISMLENFGFYRHGTKSTANGTELVLIKNFNRLQGDMLKDYPMVHARNPRKYGLSIYPAYHTQLFSDSILRNESVDILQDISHTNSIHKIYISSMNAIQQFRKGDIVLIYRTKDNQGPAYFRSVISSLCVVEEVVHIGSFHSEEDYVKYCESYSLFPRDTLQSFYRNREYQYIVKMTYNIAFKKRVTNGYLVDNVGLKPNYWGVFSLNDQQFGQILRAGEVDESLIVY